MSKQEQVFSVGIFICDACETPVNLARLILLRPNEEKAAKFKGPNKLRPVLAAFCKDCNKKENVVGGIIKKMATTYNAWVEQQT